jgi:hypothetical protein
MKKHTLLLLTLFAILAAVTACSKTDSSSGSGTPLVFQSLTVSDTTMAVNGLITLTANATGSGLEYHWTASYGSFVGSGPAVQWTVCHSDDFTINCQVTDDAGHSETRSCTIHVHV